MGAVFLEDTRQQAGKHEAKHGWWRDHGVALVRSKLAFGDYCLPPAVAVDTKASLFELAANIDAEHERFRRELVGARDAGVRLVILVENEDGVTDLDTLSRWRESDTEYRRRKFAQRRIEGVRLAKACATMERRYGVTFLFCAPEDAARVVTEILEGSYELE